MTYTEEKHFVDGWQAMEGASNLHAIIHCIIPINWLVCAVGCDFLFFLFKIRFNSTEFPHETFLYESTILRIEFDHFISFLINHFNTNWFHAWYFFTGSNQSALPKCFLSFLYSNIYKQCKIRHRLLLTQILFLSFHKWCFNYRFILRMLFIAPKKQ